MIDLKPLNLGNQDRALRLKVAAMDDGGQQGDNRELPLQVMADTLGPRLAVVSPIQGAPLYAGNRIQVRLRGVDDTRLVAFSALSGSRTLYSKALTGAQQVASFEDSFEMEVPSDQQELVIELRGRDQYGNDADPTLWRFPIGRTSRRRSPSAPRHPVRACTRAKPSPPRRWSPTTAR